MEKEIQIIKETKEDYYITWKKVKNTSYYIILGCNELFEYQEILKTTNNIIKLKKEKILNSNNIKVSSIFLDPESKEEILLQETTPITLNKKEINILVIKTILSFNGLSISFQSKEIYDK